MKKFSNHYFSEKGITLIEILASIVILSIIIVSLLSMFVQSTRSNNISKNIMDTTYVAETSMEELNRAIALSTDLENFPIEVNKLTNTDGSNCYTLISNINGQAYFERVVPGHYVYIEALSTTGNPLVKVKVKVYKDRTKAKKEAQMEMLLPWKKL
jgi:type II secretory pathway pseudopilin PulG